MFSGITNQFSSLVGAVKGGGSEEDAAAAAGQDATVAEGVATVEQDANAAAAAAAAAAGGEQPMEGEEGAKRSNSLVDSLLTEATGWLGSAKGWLGSASASIPSMPAMPSMPSMPAMPSMPSIPGLRKSGADAGDGAAADGTGQQGDGAAAVATGAADDDDKSRYISATEGADSHPASGGGTPTGDEGQIGQGKGDEVKITTKVTQQAKHFGSFLSSAINKAGAKIKETVKENPILESFNKEQEAFIKGQGGNADGVAPWIGHANEAKIKEEILGLSQDRRNFVRAPPAGVDFDFNYDTAYPTAIAIMAEDKALEQMRFELVPKIITEENFWRNYFYRVSLIIQAAELGTLGVDGVGQASSGEDAKEAALPPTLKQKNNDDQSVAVNVEKNIENAATKNSTSTVATKNVDMKVSESDEFVSDAFQSANEKDLEEIKNGMRKLGIDSMTQQALSSNDDEQWEKDLEAELKDYEVVSDAIATTSNNRNRNSNSKRGKRNSKKISSSSSSVSGNNAPKNVNDDDDDNDDELPTISNLRTRSTTNTDWEEEYADLIEDTDDLK